jgi:1-acyl-sn-glycerol-3-phosphate acyltransferase
MPAQSRFLWRVSPPVLRGVGKGFFSLRIDNEGELPTAPFVVAANHYSHFDPPLIGAALNRRIRFLALEGLFGENRLLDWLMEGYEAIPTPRDRLPVGAVRSALAALEAGDIVGLFPEATRVSHWGTLEPKRGAAWLAFKAQVPLVPVAVVGTSRAFGLENRVARAPIRVVVGSPLPPVGSTTSLMQEWAGWMEDQINRYPESEGPGPPRAYQARR